MLATETVRPRFGKHPRLAIWGPLEARLQRADLLILGGLNEGTSDILGTMVEFYANNPKEPGNYLIGEKIYISNPTGTKALRYMFKPSLDGKSPDCYTSTIGSLNVHYSSGVANHFFYLLAEGAVVPSGFGSGTTTTDAARRAFARGGASLNRSGQGAMRSGLAA